MKLGLVVGLWILFFAANVANAARETLFDGRTLAGWEGDNSVWRVREGVIVGGSLEGNPRNEFLSLAKPYRHFSLRVEYKLIGNDGFVNGGVQFRSVRIEEPPNEMSGYQADIGAGHSGKLYDESRRRKFLAEPVKEIMQGLEKPGEWNRLEIITEGPRIRIRLNGAVTVDYVERESGIADSGLIALQIHGKSKAEISFRNLTIEEYPDTIVPTAEEIMNRFGAGDAPVQAIPPFPGGKFALGRDEIIVFAGQENLVRLQDGGELEAQLATGWAEFAPRFRSMAWEGDTVYEQWRDANFGSWTDQLVAAGATVAVLQFGQMEAFAGKAKLAEFAAAYHRLLDRFAARTGRMVLLSPLPFENAASASAPFAPDLRSRNDEVHAYAEAIRAIAQQRGAVFVDLFTPLLARPAGAPRLTEDGVHLNAAGRQVVSAAIARALGARESKIKPETRAALRAAIGKKNRFWFDCWRPANWSFVYGNRVTQMFGKPAGGAPSLHETFERYKPMVAACDARIAALARGEPPPPSPELPAVPDENALTLTPEEELASFTVAEGFKIELVASEREGVVKPTQLAWDERGRLYVACSPGYPHPLPGRKASDYVLVLEDADGDGRYEKSTRLVEGLTLVQGVEPGDGGIYVCDFDRLLHVRDAGGDGRSGEQRVVFSGFGIGDTHQLVNSITHGPEGSLWFTQGHHAYSRVETPHGIAVLDSSAIWRLDPRTLRMEGFFNDSKAGHNLWGVAFDDYNQVFHKSADRIDGYYSTPGLVHDLKEVDEYHGVGNLFATNPKTTSLDIIGTRALPENLQGCAVIGGYFGNVVELHRFIDDGAGFRTEQLAKLVRSSRTEFRPVKVSVGPDGAIYVADWTNPIIGHYQASYADPARDHRHGRIWRITAKGMPPVRPPKLAGAPPAALLPYLHSPERWTRYQVKRLLFDAPRAEVLAAADRWVEKLLPSAPDYEHTLLEVAGVYVAHHSPRPALVEKLVTAKDPRVRAYAARIISFWADSLPDALGRLQRLCNDEHPRVRLEAIVACSYVSKPEAVAVALTALDRPRDRFIDYALAQTTRSLDAQWRTAFAAGRFEVGSHADYLKKIVTAAPVAAHPGKALYDTLCLNCHQADAKGLPGIYPPLANSEWVNGAPERLIKIVTQGLSGPLTVAGQSYGTINPAPMPPMGLNDQQAADVLTYIRRSFGNRSTAVPLAQVEAIRREVGARSAPWSELDLTR